jgi:hypothetical protein
MKEEELKPFQFDETTFDESYLTDYLPDEEDEDESQ